jgi:hypothetical protein
MVTEYAVWSYGPKIPFIVHAKCTCNHIELIVVDVISVCRRISRGLSEPP